MAWKPTQAQLDAVKAAGQEAVDGDLHVALAALRRALFDALPFVDAVFGGRHAKQRVVLGWSGIDVIVTKGSSLPPPTEAEVREALAALAEDVLVEVLEKK